MSIFRELTNSSVHCYGYSIKKITELKKGKDQLGFFKSKIRKQIEEEICNLEDIINENCKYAVLKKEIVDLSLFDEFLEIEKKLEDRERLAARSEVEVEILELLRDGKKRTISEMMKDSDALVKETNQKLATILRHLVEDGFVEKIYLDKKCYFSMISSETKQTQPELTSLEVEEEILKLLRDGKKRTISEIMKDSETSAGLSYHKVAAVTYKLSNCGLLEKSVIEKKAYFSITDV